MKRLLWFSVLVALMVCCSQTVKAQPPPASIVINQSNVSGGTVGNCLDITTAHKVGSTPCGSGGGAPTGPAGGSLSGTYPNPGIASSVNLPGSPTTTTQAAADNSTKVATTAYADRAATIACPSGSSGAVQKTNGTNCAASSITDDGSTVVTTEPLSAPSFTGTGSDPWIIFPSNPTSTPTAGKLFNNAGVLQFGATPLNWLNTNGTPSAGILHVAGSTQTATSSLVVPADMGPADFTTPGTSKTFSLNSGYFECTSTCTITMPVPVAGMQYCVRNANNVATVITFAAIGSSARYEATAKTSYGTAGTGTLVSGGTALDQMCLVGKDSTHFDIFSYAGTWTAN